VQEFSPKLCQEIGGRKGKTRLPLSAKVCSW
jgi:hypothetical protein